MGGGAPPCCCRGGRRLGPPPAKLGYAPHLVRAYPHGISICTPFSEPAGQEAALRPLLQWARFSLMTCTQLSTYFHTSGNSETTCAGFSSKTSRKNSCFAHLKSPSEIHSQGWHHFTDSNYWSATSGQGAGGPGHVDNSTPASCLTALSLLKDSKVKSGKTY